MPMRSPCFSAARWVLTLLRKTALVLPRSSMKNASPSRMICACLRLTPVDDSRISHSEARPIQRRDLYRRTSRNGCWSSWIRSLAMGRFDPGLSASVAGKHDAEADCILVDNADSTFCRKIAMHSDTRIPLNAILSWSRRNMARCAAALLLLAACGGPASAADAPAEGDLARELLLRADRIRFPEEGFQVDIVITTYTPDREPDERAYRILSKGNTRTLVQTTAPAAERNQILLMRERDLWAFLPNLSQPVRLPLSQRLTGQVANGDLARANFVGDYTPKILRRETLEGESYYVLQLDAVDKWVTYRKVLYWVNAKNGRPHKAAFYAVSGRLLKTGYYRDFQALGDELRPTRLVIEDALRKGQRSELVYSNMVQRDLPDRIFTKDYLKKLSR